MFGKVIVTHCLYYNNNDDASALKEQQLNASGAARITN